MNNPLWSGKELVDIFHCDIDENINLYGVSVDSRTVNKGDIFIAVKGPNFDGHDFINDALGKGAGVVIAESLPHDVVSSNSVIIVDDVILALEKLACYARARSKAKIIGITGSFGKTSVKDALYSVVSKFGHTLATERSFNSYLGVPLMMARMHTDHKYAIIEIGMNSLGEISRYSKIVKPHIAMITTVGDAHIGKMGSKDKIAEAKAEIFHGMDKNSVALLNQDNEYHTYLCEKATERGIKIINFHNDLAHDLSANGLRIMDDLGGDSFKFLITINTFARHWVGNIHAILHIIKLLNVDFQLACTALNQFTLPNGRGAIVVVNTNNHGKITILDESFNAGPQSMRNAVLALHTMAHIGNYRSIVVLGDMLELGQYTEQYHKLLLQDIINYKISQVYCCGTHIKSLYDILPDTIRGGYAEKPESLVKSIINDVKDGDMYLIKGSRGQWANQGRMFTFVRALKDLAG